MVEWPWLSPVRTLQSHSVCRQHHGHRLQGDLSGESSEATCRECWRQPLRLPPILTATSVVLLPTLTNSYHRHEQQCLWSDHADGWHGIWKLSVEWVSEWVNHTNILLKNRQVMCLVSSFPKGERVRRSFWLSNQLTQLSRNLSRWMSRSRHKAQKPLLKQLSVFDPNCVTMERVQSDTVSISGSVPETDVVQLLGPRSIPSKLCRMIYTGVTWYKAF